MKRIAIIGSAPSSVALAPYNDPSWTMWGCSPGAYPQFAAAKRQPDSWFEMHKWEPGKPWFVPDYMSWMAALKCPVYVHDINMPVPTATLYPVQAILEKWVPFASYFLTCTPAWMMALAILSGAEEIGLWGIDMSAQEEWQEQRPAMQFWVCTAEHMGIKVTLPPESDLMCPPQLYGVSESDPMYIKLVTRDNEIGARINLLDQQIQSAVNEKMFLCGAKENNLYTRKTWVRDPRAIALGVQGAPRPPLPHDNKEEALAKVAAGLAPNGALGDPLHGVRLGAEPAIEAAGP